MESGLATICDCSFADIPKKPATSPSIRIAAFLPRIFVTITYAFLQPVGEESGYSEHQTNINIMKLTSGNTYPLSLTVLFVVLATSLVGCATITTGAHFDETTNFGKYQNFSWIDEQPYIIGSDKSGPAVSALTQEKIQRAIRSDLEAKGYSFVEDRTQADFVVAYTVGTRQKISIESYPDPYYGSWGWHVHGSHYYISEVRAHSYTRGTLSVDIFDGASKKPVWHGWAQKTITTKDKQDPTPTIDAGVRQLLEVFPSASQ